MIGKLEKYLRETRRFFSRSEWLARWLKLPIFEGSASRPGLLMIQLDGLSRREFEKALAKGEMPFMQRLLQREHYQLKTLYSGLPSSTPAVQAELFYGVKQAVPAFSFKDAHLQRIIRMYEPEAATQLEKRLLAEGDEPLLREGSAYSDIYTGGAAEAHFCPAALGWGPSLRRVNFLVTLVLLLSNAYSFLRTALLLLLEFGLAFVDFFRGINHGHNFFKELKFVPTRVAICILLRELMVIGAKIDIVRGLPVIHLNFLGYDEQAHRRGPDSQFAHWTLKGIDDAVKRLWVAAGRAKWRHYDVWIYSDHGQARVLSYEQRQGLTIEKAVQETFQHLDETNGGGWDAVAETIQTQRANLLGGIRFQKLLFRRPSRPPDNAGDLAAVVALGPVGFIYPNRELTAAERECVARELTGTYGVPAVIFRREEGELRVCTSKSDFDLAGQAELLFGADHPFLGEIEKDLDALCRHPGAGTFTLLGWSAGARGVSFAVERGAHAGIRIEETEAFSLLPEDTAFPATEKAYLGVPELRRAALQHLGRRKVQLESRWQGKGRGTKERLRVMTYNVHSCVGMDGKLAPERIARVIARARPDVVALQELDVGRARSGGMDQAHRIAHYLEMEYHFHPALHLEEERYGDAILTHLPLRLIKAGSLPIPTDKPYLEPRGALWVAIDWHGTEIQILNTHLGLLSAERMAQIKALLGPEWLAGCPPCTPLILCGDFNAGPSSPVFRRISERLLEVQSVGPRLRPKNTFASRLPMARIDHIFINKKLTVVGTEVPRSELTMVASDHLPLIAELRL
jgi:endonuclease/exonuclease/phosphatase family metal-dependent hydrolase